MYSTPTKKRSRSVSRTPRTPRKKIRFSAANNVVENQSTSVVPRFNMASALPKQISVKLKYYQSVSLDPGVAGAVSVNVFSANGAYDPDITGSGGQPRGLDQWFALYAKGLVTSSRITVKGLSTTFVDCGLLGVTLMNKAAAEITPKPYIEDPRTAWVQAANVQTSDQEARLSYGPKSFLNIKDPIDDDTLHFSSVSNAPKAAYYHVWFGPLSSTQNPGAFTTQVVIEYSITFFEPVALASS